LNWSPTILKPRRQEGDLTDANNADEPMNYRLVRLDNPTRDGG
jgi:hypothetical protein